MPQFRPYWWINLISWMILIFTFLVWYHQSINFPKILLKLICRYQLLFN